MKQILKLFLIAIAGLCVIRMFGAPGPEYWAAVSRVFGSLAIIVVLCDYALMGLIVFFCYKGITVLDRRRKPKKTPAQLYYEKMQDEIKRTGYPREG